MQIGYVNMGEFCILTLCKEISDNLHPSTEQQAESNDLVQATSQSMEYRMVDVDEDPEESLFQDAPPIWLSNQQILLQNLCLDPLPPFQLHRSK